MQMADSNITGTTRYLMERDAATKAVGKLQDELAARDQRIEELEKRLKFAEELIGWETYYFKHGPHPYVWWRRPIGKGEYDVCHELPKREHLEADNKRLRDLLNEYARHKEGCSAALGEQYHCKCGWAAALAPQPAKEGKWMWEECNVSGCVTNVSTDEETGMCQACAYQRAAAWDALWEWYEKANTELREKGKCFFVPPLEFFQKATDLQQELENDDGKSGFVTADEIKDATDAANDLSERLSK